MKKIKIMRNQHFLMNFFCLGLPLSIQFWLDFDRFKLRIMLFTLILKLKRRKTAVNNLALNMTKSGGKGRGTSKRPLERKKKKSSQPSTHTYIDRFNTWQGNKNTARRRGKNAHTHLEKQQREEQIL